MKTKVQLLKIVSKYENMQSSTKMCS